jgi:hypothetical protein
MTNFYHFLPNILTLAICNATTNKLNINSKFIDNSEISKQILVAWYYSLFTNKKRSNNKKDNNRKVKNLNKWSKKANQKMKGKRNNKPQNSKKLLM